ncbi:MAG: hypothetical protein JKY65_01090 [Planctomycetes bacterium]|nr:hypothetical protein [Planctomycetota bacterium]
MSTTAHLIRQLDFEALVSDALRNEAPLVRCLHAGGDEEVAEAIEESFDLEGGTEPLVLLLLLHEGAESLELGVGSVPFFRFRGQLVPLLERPISKPVLLQFTDRLPFPTGTGALAGCTLRLTGGSERVQISLCGPPPTLADLDPHNDLAPPLTEVRAGLVVVSGLVGTRPELTTSAIVSSLAAERDLRIAILDPPESVEFMGTRSLLTCHNGAEAGSWEETFGRALREDVDLIAAGDLKPERLETVLRAALGGHIVVLTANADTLGDLIRDLGWAYGPSEQRLLAFLLADAIQLLVVQRRIKGGVRLEFDVLAGSEELSRSLRDLHPPPIKRLLRAEQTRRRGWQGLGGDAGGSSDEAKEEVEA